jgi:hypothetical protein
MTLARFQGSNGGTILTAILYYFRLASSTSQNSSAGLQKDLQTIPKVPALGQEVLHLWKRTERKDFTTDLKLDMVG